VTTTCVAVTQNEDEILQNLAQHWLLFIDFVCCCTGGGSFMQACQEDIHGCVFIEKAALHGGQGTRVLMVLY